MSELKFAVVLVNSKNNNFNIFSHFSVFTWVVETFQPAEVRDVNHTTNSGSEFNKYTVRSNVFHNTFMTASFWEFGFDIRPWILRKLFDRKTHLPVILV